MFYQNETARNNQVIIDQSYQFCWKFFNFRIGTISNFDTHIWKVYLQLS